MGDDKEKIILEILESYINFLDIVLTKPNPFIKLMAERRLRDWKPILEELKDKGGR